MILQRLRPFSPVTMSLTVSLFSFSIIGEGRIKEKCQEQRIGKIKTIGRYTVWQFTSCSTFISKAESCRTSSFGEHFLPVLLRSHEQRMLHSRYKLEPARSQPASAPLRQSRPTRERFRGPFSLELCLSLRVRWWSKPEGCLTNLSKLTNALFYGYTAYLQGVVWSERAKTTNTTRTAPPFSPPA